MAESDAIIAGSIPEQRDLGGIAFPYVLKPSGEAHTSAASLISWISRWAHKTFFTVDDVICL
jgi:hypothetical protein